MFEAIILFVLIFFSAFFSGSETGIYSISRLKLRINREKGKPVDRILHKLLLDDYGLVFTTLCGTNLTNYLTGSIVTGLFLAQGLAGYKAEIYATLILTPVLFLFSEALPKHIYYSKADKLMPLGGWMLWVWHKIFTYTGLVPFLKLLSRIAAKLIGSKQKGETLINTAQRHHITEIVRQTFKEGALSVVQAKILEKIVNISNANAGSVMVPIKYVLMVSSKIKHEELHQELARSHHQYRLVYEGNQQNIIGYISILELLNSDIKSDEITAFIRPLSQIPAETPVMKALNIMIKAGHKILLITSQTILGKTTIEGIVTIKDLAHKITQDENNE